MKVTFTVNGVAHEGEAEPRELLVHYLRGNLGLTGTHVGCDTSQCGACTILLDGDAVKSCTVLAELGRRVIDRERAVVVESRRDHDVLRIWAAAACTARMMFT